MRRAQSAPARTKLRRRLSGLPSGVRSDQAIPEERLGTDPGRKARNRRECSLGLAQGQDGRLRDDGARSEHARYTDQHRAAQDADDPDGRIR